MRRKVIIGNWKMNKTLSEARGFIYDIKNGLSEVSDIEVGVCPTSICLTAVKDELRDSNIKVGAQNVYFENQGAYTGEISATMLKDIDIDYCIIGHSERRQLFSETDETVNKKLKKLLEYQITPVVCVGENLDERNQNLHFEIVRNQIYKAFEDINENDMSSIIIAYEPVWAIGTGITATAQQAEEMCKYIRQEISKMYSENIANSIRIQYGGSVNISNSKEILSMPNIDGALIGGASLKSEFIDIVKKC